MLFTVSDIIILRLLSENILLYAKHVNDFLYKISSF